MPRILYPELLQTLSRILEGKGFTGPRARECARLFAETTRDGVYSHGVNRFPRFLAMIDNGTVDIRAQPELVIAGTALERWNGRHGPGNLNALASMDRAIKLARQYGVGCVALAHTNHWMRGGTYGWQAADAGMIGLCWTNTMPNLPAWGAATAVLGNNPMIIAVPRQGGHLVLDMAMSQFSYGALAGYRERGEMLPVDGGFDSSGKLTRDPRAIEESHRALPIGYWKGSGLSLLLDAVAATLSGGLAAFEIPQDPLHEGDLSQIFLALDPSKIGAGVKVEHQAGVEVVASAGVGIVNRMIDAIQQTEPERKVRYPGEKILKTRAENMEQGVPVDDVLWNELQHL